MVVSVLIAGVMMLGVTAFISSSRVSYSRVNTSVVLQEEAGMTTRFLSEIVKEATWVGYDEDFSYTDGDGKTYTIDFLVFEAPDNLTTLASGREDNLTNYCYIVFWEQENQSLRYVKVPSYAEANPLDPDDEGHLDGFSKASYLTNTVKSDYYVDFIEDAIGSPYSLVSQYVSDMTIELDEDNPRLFKMFFEFSYAGETYVTNVNGGFRND